MAKKTQKSTPRKAASPKTKAAKKPAKSAKKKPAARTSAAKKPRTAKSSRSSRQSTKSATSRTKKATTKKAPTRKATKRASRKTAAKSKKSAATIRKSVDGYVASLNDWRKECVGSLRKMIRKAAPQASEKVKWSQPVYEHHGPFAWIKAHTKHVNLGFWRGVELPDPRKLLKGTGTKMRHIKLSNLKDAGKRELQELVRLAAKLNEIKGNPTRKAKPKSKPK